MTTHKKKGAMLLALLLIVSLLLSLAPVSRETAQAASTNKEYYAKINKGTNVVTIYEADGTPYTAFTASTGSATPVGTFYTMAKYRWWTLDGPCYGQYCTRITGHILFHSVWYYSQTTDSQSYVQYNKLGTTASHGCVRLTVAASKWIYDNCATGMKVIIFNGTSKDDPLGKPETIQVEGSRGWDPTDPASGNPYKTGSTKPTITISSKTLDYGSKFGDGNMTCKDSGGFDITSWVKQTGTVNTKKLGSYTVTYSVVDSFGRTAKKTVTYKVVDKSKAILSGVKESLTKSYGTTRNMLVGLKAKDAAGKNLTGKIKVYVKAPGQKSYHKLSDTNYTFEKEGTYRVKYAVTNPNSGKKTVVKQTITVKNKQAPILADTNDWETLTLEKSGQKYTWKKLMSGVSASLSSGTDITSTVTIAVTSPNGTKTTLAKGDSYTFTEEGDYTLVYTAKNPDASGAKKTVKASRTVTVPVQEVEEPEPSDQPEQSDSSDATDSTEQPEVTPNE
jgi:hypothetical protein